ncbi:MAG TPA: GntR family transcriptional regulator [Candidatus Fimimorpha excrementavium]|nr:GntR family transcriptional regulator [Candidatus Fimimorpha excrementavium]
MLNHAKGAAPLYSQLETILREQIESGEYTKGDVFPTEKMLMEQYQVSRVTVRQACAALINDGYIKSSRGIGTVVIYEKIDEHLKRVISFTDEMKQHNITMKTTYCKMEEVHPPIPASKALEVPVTDTCYCLTRVRCVGGKPLVYTVTYLKKVCALPMDSECYMESLYQYLREEQGITIERGRDTLEAALPTKEVQGFLQIDSQMPVFKRTRQTFLKDGSVFEYSVCYYPGNRYQYTVDL